MADRNGIELLEEDHQELRLLLNQLENAASHDQDEVADLCDELALLLRAHTTIEEELFYPAHLEARGDHPGEVLYFEAMAEHRIAKMLMVELRETPRNTPQFEAGVRLLRSMLEHHLEEEEQTIFPSASDHMSADELTQLGLSLANIEAPPGREGPAGDYVYDWMAREGFAPERLGVFPDRFNVVGRLRGTGGGASLSFNSHLDTIMSRADTARFTDAGNRIYHECWLDDGKLYGYPLVNCKGPMTCWLIAAKALNQAGVLSYRPLLFDSSGNAGPTVWCDGLIVGGGSGWIDAGLAQGDDDL
jgi:hemerythrin-like domain-containing protein